MNLSVLWAAFALNVIAALVAARLSELCFTKAARIAIGGVAISCALFAVFLLLKATEWTLGN